MKTKQLTYLIAALVVVTAAILISNHFANKKPAGDERLFFPGVKKEDIASIEVMEKDSVGKILRKNNLWVVPSCNDYRADSAKVENALTAVAEMEKTDLISTKKEKHAKFGVDSASSLRIVAKNGTGKVIADFLVGNRALDRSKEFVLKTGTEKVYTNNIVVRNKLYSKNEDWKDRGVWVINPEMVQAIELEYDTVKLAVARNDSGNWSLTYPDPFPADSVKTLDLLKSLVELKTNKWAPESDSAVTFKNPTFAAKILYGDGRELALTVGGQNEQKMYYLKTSQDEKTIFLLSEYKIKRLKKTWDNLKGKLPEPAVDTAANPG